MLGDEPAGVGLVAPDASSPRAEARFDVSTIHGAALAP